MQNGTVRIQKTDEMSANPAPVLQSSPIILGKMMVLNPQGIAYRITAITTTSFAKKQDNIIHNVTGIRIRRNMLRILGTVKTSFFQFLINMDFSSVGYVPDKVKLVKLNHVIALAQSPSAKICCQWEMERKVLPGDLIQFAGHGQSAKGLE